MKKIYFKKKSKKIYLYFVVTIVFIVFTVFMAIQSATMGSELAYYEQEEQKLIGNNESLKDLMIRNESLESYSRKAEELGFVKPKDIVYTHDEKEVAKLP